MKWRRILTLGLTFFLFFIIPYWVNGQKAPKEPPNIEKVIFPEKYLPNIKEKAIFLGKGYGINSIAISPDSSLFAAGETDKDRSIAIWDLKTHKVRNVFKGHPNVVLKMGFTINGKKLITISYEGDGKEIFSDIFVWDLDLGQLSWKISVKGKALALYPEGFVATISNLNRNLIHVYNLDNGEKIITYKEHKSEVGGIAFSPNGQLVASVEKNGTINFWKIFKGENQFQLSVGEDYDGIFFSPDNKRIIASRLGYYRLIDLPKTKNLLGNIGECLSRFSPDGRMVGRPSSKKITLASTKTKRLVAFLTTDEPKWQVRVIAFSSDGKHILGGGSNGIIRMWALPPIKE